MKLENGGVFSILLESLPKRPETWDRAENHRFWTNGEEILCSTEAEQGIIASFIESLLHGSGVTVRTGYYDPYEDAASGETDDLTGFFYVDIE